MLILERITWLLRQEVYGSIPRNRHNLNKIVVNPNIKNYEGLENLVQIIVVVGLQD